MNLIGAVTESLRRLNQRLLKMILQFGLPRYGKKLVLLVSIFSGLRHLKTVTSTDLEKLNAKLGLASCTEALEFPALVSKTVWERCEWDGDSLKNACHGSAADLVCRIPKWLRYDTSEVMAKDIRNVVIHSQLQMT